MKLRTFLAETKTPAIQFAEAIGVSVVAVHRYSGGERIPRPEVMERISVASAGRVQPNDFYDFPHDEDAGSGQVQPQAGEVV